MYKRGSPMYTSSGHTASVFPSLKPTLPTSPQRCSLTSLDLFSGSSSIQRKLSDRMLRETSPPIVSPCECHTHTYRNHRSFFTGGKIPRGVNQKVGGPRSHAEKTRWMRSTSNRSGGLGRVRNPVGKRKRQGRKAAGGVWLDPP